MRKRPGLPAKSDNLHLNATLRFAEGTVRGD